MQDTINGIIPFIILMAMVFAASRVPARFTGAKYERALMPLAPIINGTFSTDSLSHGWLAGTYGSRTVHVASTPNVNSMRRAQKKLTHRDNISPKIAPSAEHFQRQLHLVTRLAQLNEQVNPA